MDGGEVHRRWPGDPRYIRETAAEYGIDQQIRFNQRLRRAEWSSAEGRWTVEVERTQTGDQRAKRVERVQMTCAFLYMCTGYYEYNQGYTPEWAGRERFAGRIIHPQEWPADLDYARSGWW